MELNKIIDQTTNSAEKSVANIGNKIDSIATSIVDNLWDRLGLWSLKDSVKTKLWLTTLKYQLQQTVSHVEHNELPSWYEKYSLIINNVVEHADKFSQAHTKATLLNTIINIPWLNNALKGINTWEFASLDHTLHANQISQIAIINYLAELVKKASPTVITDLSQTTLDVIVWIDEKWNEQVLCRTKSGYIPYDANNPTTDTTAYDSYGSLIHWLVEYSNGTVSYMYPMIQSTTTSPVTSIPSSNQIDAAKTAQELMNKSWTSPTV